MEFKYDAIFGLSYSGLNPIYIVDACKIPNGFNLDDVLNIYINKDIDITLSVEEIYTIISNY